MILKLRDETDCTEKEQVSDYEIQGYLNDGQRAIQAIIFQSNPSSDIFTKQYIIPTTDGITSYNLPEDIYAENAVVSVNYIQDSKIIQSLQRVEYREKQTLFGYALVNDKMILSSTPNLTASRELLLNYTAQLPLMGLRVGKISSILGQVITLASNDLEGFSDRYEYVTLVDKFGAPLQTEDASGNFITNEYYVDSEVGPSITVEGDLTNADDTYYVVVGNSATSHCVLPMETINYLKSYARRRILKRNSSPELAAESMFSQEEVETMAGMFADNVKDALYPVAFDTDYMDY